MPIYFKQGPFLLFQLNGSWEIKSMLTSFPNPLWVKNRIIHRVFLFSIQWHFDLSCFHAIYRVTILNYGGGRGKMVVRAVENIHRVRFGTTHYAKGISMIMIMMSFTIRETLVSASVIMTLRTLLGKGKG